MRAALHDRYSPLHFASMDNSSVSLNRSDINNEVSSPSTVPIIPLSPPPVYTNVVNNRSGNYSASSHSFSHDPWDSRTQNNIKNSNQYTNTKRNISSAFTPPITNSTSISIGNININNDNNNNDNNDNNVLNNTISFSNRSSSSNKDGKRKRKRNIPYQRSKKPNVDVTTEFSSAYPLQQYYNKSHYTTHFSSVSRDHITEQSNPHYSNRSKLTMIRQHWIRFCETTSLRGIPRIIKSSNPKQKYLWVFFVLLFFVACLTCIGLLIIQYREYDVIHQPKTMYNQPRSFPSLTLCNLRPFTPNGFKILEENNILTPEKYILHLKHGAYKYKNKLSSTLKKLVTVSWNMDTFIMNLPKHIDVTDLGHSLYGMVITCSIVYKDGLYSSMRSCDTAGKWVATKNQLFNNCYTFTVSDNFTKRTTTLDMIVNLNIGNNSICLDCFQGILESQLTGAYLNLHYQGTYPEVQTEGLKLLPGTMTVIRFTPREWSMMEPPHGKCSKKLRKTILFEGKEFRYSEGSCKHHIFQNNLLDKCGCVKFRRVPTELMWAINDRKICTYLKFPVLKNETNFNLTLNALYEYTNRTKCELEIATTLTRKLEECKSECTYFTYDTSISFGQWPAKSFHTVMISTINRMLKRLLSRPKKDKKHIEQMKELLEKLEPYKEVLKYQNSDPDKAINTLNKLDFIEKNLLSVQVYRANFDLTKVEEKAVISLTSFLSQAGGLCSIWSGITFVCIVELFELVIMVFDTIFIYNYSNSQKNNDNSCDNELDWFRS